MMPNQLESNTGSNTQNYGGFIITGNERCTILDERRQLEILNQALPYAVERTCYFRKSKSLQELVQSISLRLSNQHSAIRHCTTNHNSSCMYAQLDGLLSETVPVSGLQREWNVISTNISQRSSRILISSYFVPRQPTSGQMSP